MSQSVNTITYVHLSAAFIPVILVIYILYTWSLNYKTALYAIARMLGQLTLVGYFLAYLFETQYSLTIILALTVMLFISSWIALRTIAYQKTLYIQALLAILLGGGLTLILVTQFVLELTPWFYPRYMIPLGGMIFSNAMNSVSLAAERFFSEYENNKDYARARNTAFRAALIPLTNSLFAVGLVSVPGMMSGQILSGVSPLIAARYQIMVMAMIYGSAGLASAAFLSFIKPKLAARV